MYRYSSSNIFLHLLPKEEQLDENKDEICEKLKSISFKERGSLDMEKKKKIDVQLDDLAPSESRADHFDNAEQNRKEIKERKVAHTDRLGPLAIEQMYGDLSNYAKDQFGSRHLQRALEDCSNRELQVVLDEISSKVLELMADLFGNYVMQKLFIIGNDNHREFLFKKIKGHVYQLSVHPHGCRVVQAVVQHSQPDAQFEILGELEGKLLSCSKDQNGNHVIQKLVENTTEKGLKIICKSLSPHTKELCQHMYGCRVVQRLLEHCTPKMLKPLHCNIFPEIVQLSMDQYGNYVVQQVLEYDKLGFATNIVINSLQGVLGELSQHKFASNVVEKCLIAGSQDNRKEMIFEFLAPKNDAPTLSELMKDQYANYVVQTMIDVADETLKEILIDNLRQHIPTLRYSKNARNFLSKFSGAASKFSSPKDISSV